MKRVRGKGGRATPEVFLAAFGKHPGWDDHIEDIGIETNHLAALKQLLYVQGIGGTIDSGAWDNLTEAQRREGFRHVFVCRAEGDIFVGRLWSSRDGKGRARYPMVVCAQCRGLSLPWAVREVLPRLETVQQRCVQSPSAEEVIGIIDDARRELRQVAEQVAPGQPDLVISPGALAEVADRMDGGADHEGLFRILYQIEREMPQYLYGEAAPGARDDERRPNQIRVPACGDSVEDVCLQWFCFMLGRLDATAPVWAILPLELSWVDIFVGAPAPQQFFCLQASREAMPMASEIPYTLEEDFIGRCETLIGASRDGVQREIVIESQGAMAAGRPRKEPLDVWGKLAAVGRSRTLRWVLGILLAIALVITALLAVSSILSAGPGPGPSEEHPGTTMSDTDAARWEALCTAFYEWFGSFLADVDKGRLERWQRDRHLADRVVPVLRQVQAGTLKLDPRRISGAVGGNLSLLGRNPPDSAKRPEVVQQTKRALEIVKGIEAALGPEGWPRMKDLSRLASEYRKRGWLRQSDYIASVPGRIRFAPGLASAVDTVMTAAKKVEDVETLWTEVQKQGRTLSGTGNELLAMFDRYALIETRSAPGAGTEADLDATISGLADVRKLGGKLVDFVEHDWQNVDVVLVRKNPPVPLPSSPEELKGGVILRRWYAAVQSDQYKKLDPALDPRETGQWKHQQQTALAGIMGKIVELRTKHGYKKTDELLAKLRGLQAKFLDICRIRWDRENKDKIAQLVLDFKAKRTPLANEVGAVVASVIGGRKAYIANIPRTISDSARINGLWQQRVEQLKKITDLGELTTKVEQLKSDLSRLDGELPATFTAASAKGGWSARLTSQVFLEKREEILSRALKALKWQDDALVRDAEFEGRWKTLRGELARWQGEVAKLIDAFDAIDAALAAGALPDEKVAPAGKSIAQLHEEWHSRAVLRESGVSAAVEPITRRIGRLAAVAKSTNRRQLVQWAGKPVRGNFEAARAAWLRLGKLPGAWPANPKQFGEEREIHQTLLAVYGLVEDAGRRSQLEKELVRETRRRWEDYLAARSDPAEIDDAIQRMGEFHLDISKADSLKPLSRLRIGLYDFRRRMLTPRASMEDKVVQEQIGEFLASVARLPGGIAAQPAVTGFVAELKKIATARDSGADLTKAGPALAGWKADVSPDGAYVRYSWSTSGGERHALSFVRIEPKGQKPSYLCTTEMSVGLFIDVVNARRRMPDVRKLLKDYDSPHTDPRRGPRVWELVEGDGSKTIKGANSWTAPLTGIDESLIYSKQLKPGRPHRAHPMQYVSAQAAIYLARMLGSRLPTSAEWRRAQETFEKGHHNPAVNLRDKTWEKQKNHIADMEQKGDFVPTGLYPDEGIFWPKGRDQRSEGAGAKALNRDDGVLWFAKVDADKPRRFHHLLGNVAEFVFEAPAELAKVKNLSAAAAEKFMTRHAAGLRVIGGSALSPPALDPATAYGVEPTDATSGYSDVGFRLAFTAPAEPLHLRLRRLLNSRGYLPELAGK